MEAKKEFEVSSLPVKQVTVYQDRAEVKRALKASLQLGPNEVVVNKLSGSIDQDSIRVEGRGAATISEVKYQEEFVKQEEEVNAKQKELRKKLSELSENRSLVEGEQSRLLKQKSVMDGVATRVASGSSDKEKGDSLAVVNESLLDGVEKLLAFYEKRVGELDRQLLAVKKRLEEIDEEIAVTQMNLNEAGGPPATLARRVSILLEAGKEGEVELDVSYLVRDASWTPSYDVRVFADESLLKLHYFGFIQQSTGEDWTETQVSLSTATPSIGGSVPELLTQKVFFYRPPPPAVNYALPRGARVLKAMAFGAQSEALHYDPTIEDSYMPAMSFAAAEVKASVVSTSFEIARKTSIPSDNIQHKVTVAIADLKPSFEYETVPRKTPYAFLKARVTNTSAYPLLAGDTSVFLDNNFVARSRLSAVSPSEEFTCCLGVDPAVRVVYKPVHKFHEETGLISKYSVVTYEQKIEIKNTRQEKIKIRVNEQVPLSSEEKVKVALVEPQLAKNDKDKGPVRLNKANNLEWDVDVPKGESQVLTVKYTIEHPRSEQLDFKEE